MTSLFWPIQSDTPCSPFSEKSPQMAGVVVTLCRSPEGWARSDSESPLPYPFPCSSSPMGPEKGPSPLTCFPSPHLFSSLESSTSEVNVDSAPLPDPSQLPSQTLWPRCRLYFVPHPPPVPFCLGQLPPCYPVAQPTQGGDTPACPQWTSSL